MRLSEQNKLYYDFMEEASALLKKDNSPIVENIIEIMFFDLKSSTKMQLAFNNVLWKLDERYEANMKGELENIIKMIPKIADPDDQNTKRIVQAFQQMVDAEEEETETLTQEEIDAELADFDEEEDNSPLI